VLRNGQTIDGSLYDIGGTSPLKLTIKTATAIARCRRTTSRASSRGRRTRGDAARPGDRRHAGGRRRDHRAGEPAVDQHGITVRKGQTLTFTTTGESQLSDDANDIATPTARRAAAIADGRSERLRGRADRPHRPNGSRSHRAPDHHRRAGAGVLYLGVNDDGFPDNRGSYQVVIR
jgi:hypothetical protein